ncbi:hypothetical protein OMW55_01980 [Sphingomonas sp. BN140010]|uniref:Cell division protein FtsK n=1 Tax=Sphingomonas arvum TaxID=2992113 RepID=A0ABT3JBY1_9SPHN|nr:hypothetical protein [Sphingomonas sp. BN140010]MCW3796578.1 hypothetical protein [Sphingomonas sp. BN140010]
MLVYGDHAELVDPRARLAEIAADLATGELAHDRLTRTFVDLAGVTQGVADADFEASGEDRVRPAELLLLQQLTRLAGALLGSWEGQPARPLPPVQQSDDLPDRVAVKLPEGYAFYALRPEAYALAARQLHLTAPPRIIGLRSIGTGLACMAAAALNAPPPFTVRPTGDPFARELRLADEFAAALLDGDPHFVVVDEGPGMSGSSFGAVAEWLEDRGVAPDRIAFLPGHSNPLGTQASKRHRRRWTTAQRPVVQLDEPRWSDVARFTGPIRGTADLSAGRWRPLWSAAQADWPAIDPMWERRKFLVHADDGAWLVKFAGLGRIGDRRLDLALRLEDAGFGSEVAGLTGGWLVSRWEDASPTRPSVGELIAYLRWRRGLAAPQPGASLATLVTMVHRNLPALADWSPDLTGLAPHPVCTDGRMAAHEWLRLPSGQLRKADAVDHHQAHDLIGCQDIAWDVAGAILELDLSASDADRLAAALDCNPALLAFTLVAHAAFRVGAHRLSASTLDHWPDEQRRNLLAAERMERRLAAVDAIQHPGHVH